MRSTFDPLEPRLLLSRVVTPLAPSALVVSSASVGDVQLTFSDNSRNETGFVIERAMGRGAYSVIGTLAGSPGRGMRTFDDKSVSPGTAYRYEVKATIGRHVSSTFAGPVAVTTPVVHHPPPPGESSRNLLFFGNSFTLYNGLATLVADIAAADGHPPPSVHVQATFGWTLMQHLDKVNADGAANVIDSSLAAGQHWDDVIEQGNSVEATSATAIGGNVPAFLSAATGLFQHVRQNSPQAHAVLVETWARGADNPYYPADFSGPAEMQNQIQSNYGAAVSNLDSIGGANAAEVAPAGEAWRAQNWDRSLYDGPDEYHPSPRGSLLAALTVYSTIYHDGVSDIPAAKVSADLAQLELTAADWAQLIAAADSVDHGLIAKA